MNQGKTYLVKHLDISSKTAWCQQADVNYYTKTRDYTDIHVIGSNIVCNDFNTFFSVLFLFRHLCTLCMLELYFILFSSNRA